MPKLVALLAKREDISVEDFRKHYENNHVPLIMSMLESFITAYSRSYVDRDNPVSAALVDPVDVITELEFAEQSDMDRMFAHMGANPEKAAMVSEDEARFLDTSLIRFLVVSDERITPLS